MSKSVAPISIARHTLQFILRCAIDAEPARCFGLIGRRGDHRHNSTVSHAMPLAALGTAEDAARQLANSDLQHTLAGWSQQAVAPCGIYFATENGHLPALSELKTMEQALRKLMPADALSPPLLLPLMLNTAGCLEAFACQMDGESLRSLPLLLAEDGQQTKNG